MRGVARLRATALNTRETFGYRRLLTSGTPRIGYIGWVDKGNAGDEAMYVAHRRALPACSIVPLPNLPANRPMRAAQRFRPLDAVLLGGGTLIGNGYFRRTLEAQLDAGRSGMPFDMLGVGVESDEFTIGRRTSIAAELSKWVPMLDAFPQVRVRGPLSSQTLAAFGVESVVVGDPALLLQPRVAPVATERLLGLNVGSADDQWGDAEVLSDFMVRLGTVFRERGWRIRLVPTWTKDVPVLRRIAERLGDGVDVWPLSDDIDHLLSGLGQCTALVAQKLHAVVLGSVVNVPAIVLEYRPKVRDFQASIAREQFTMRTDRLDLDAAVGMLEEFDVRRDAHVVDIERAVALRRSDLQNHAGAISARLSTRART